MKFTVNAIILGIFALILSPSICCHSVEPEPIIVHLNTEQSLKPLYLAPLTDDHAGFDETYLRKLEGVLQFDLAHNGRTKLVDLPPNDRSVAAEGFDDFGSSTVWNSRSIAYVIKVQVKEQRISAKILSTGVSSLKSIDPLPLTGNLNQDRCQLHRLADAIHRALFGVEGIATTHVLYTFKYPIFKESKQVWLSEIWEIDYDGANARKVSSDDSGYCITPCHVPPQPGKKSAAFLYVSYKNGQPKIYLSNLKDGAVARLNYLRGNQLMPAMSLQRDKIAFISDIAGNPDLFFQEFSPDTGVIGKPRQIFTARHATQGTPSFSPEGKQIAFVSNKDGSPRIYSISIPSVNTPLKEVKTQLISRVNRESTAPCWSPDGSKLAYCARQGQERQIWIYDFSNGEEWQLTFGPGDKENPSWAPDSLHLIYNTTGKRSSDLYMVDLNLRTPIKITSGSGEKRFPSWEPRA